MNSNRGRYPLGRGAPPNPDYQLYQQNHQQQQWQQWSPRAGNANEVQKTTSQPHIASSDPKTNDCSLLVLD
ncbi:hypothetical protein Bca52824_037352 [Brassica carinata]|uniref:Uncharacterized protein n=1 Tax=Brassica carinata TaxID=52824 RepID=A0A8X7S8Y4_BRACI|nr:hypothetical protein Bca52824_037352 [Brassica carinata]